MKPEDRLQILPSSPISVLESTRKDFKVLLLGSANSSSEEVQERKTKQTNQSKRHRFKKQEKHRNSVKEHVELREFSSVQNKTIINVGLQQNLVKVKSHTNPSFWYEDEQQNEMSSCSSSLNSEKLKKVKSSSNSPELVHSSSVERATIHHERRASPAITNSSDDENNSDNVLSVAPSGGSQHTRTSISSSHPGKINSNKESHKNSRQTSVKNLYSSASSSSDHNIEEENSAGYQESNETLSLEHSILKIVVHHCDRLILDQPKSQPLIVVHAVNCKTGRYIVHNKVPVSPQFTGSCIAHSPHQVSNKSNALPEWNQEMVFDLDADKYLSEILFLFELVSEPNTTVSSLLAWGFLRPMSRTGVKQISKKLQLQLYKTPARRLFGHATHRPTISDLFNWFNSAEKEKYPATLYVTLLSSGSSKSSTVTKESRFNVTSPLRGGRLSGQPFKLPTRRGFTFESAAAGALIACYRSDGSSLAFALSTGDIMVYQNSVISLHLKGHQGNVYDLEWNKNEGGEGWRLLSCGADCTARVWNDSNDVVLPHPAYVYSARFGESDDRVVTGCFDQLIRLWELNSSTPRLISTYVQHRAPINSLCWDSHGRLFTADAKGSICVWNSTISGLHFEKILNESSEEYRNETPINCLCFHPSGGRLLVHYRGSKMCLLESESGLKLISYSGIYNPRLRLASSISPCGGYVISGSEDGSVHWFDLERGDLVAVTTLPTSTIDPVMAVAFHPTCHAIALCSMSSQCCLSVLEFNAADTGIEGFSLRTFPRTVQSAVSPIENISKNNISQGRNCTPTLDKLERIFKKLDLVMAWSDSHKKSLEK